ncbi:MAG: PhnE/PtxC family ABC transporter permease, partial [Roseiflexaceae bacterium]
MTTVTPPRPTPARPLNVGALVLQITVIGLILLTIYGFTTFDTNEVDMGMALDMLGSNTQAMFLDPHLSNTTFSKMIDALLITIGLGFLSTVIGAVIALVLALGSALNLSPAWLSIIIRALTAFVRAVPTVLWVLILAVSAGLG